MKKVWTVRQPKGKGASQDCRNGIFSIDIGVHGDVSQVFSLEDAIHLVEADYPDLPVSKIESRAGSLFSFVSDISPGDMILAPVPETREVFVLMAEGEITISGSGLPARKGKIIGVMSRDRIPGDIRNSLGAHVAVSLVRAEDAHRRVLSVVSGSVVPTPQENPGSSLDGHQMADLVGGILRGGGYSVSVSPPGPDGGVDIRAGKGLLALDETVLVQVKSGKVVCDLREVDRTIGVAQMSGASAALIVSWGGFSRDALHRGHDHWFRLRLWSADQVRQNAGLAIPYLQGPVLEAARRMTGAGT